MEPFVKEKVVEHGRASNRGNRGNGGNVLIDEKSFN